MIIILLIGLALIAVTFVLFARVLLLPRIRRAEALEQISGYGFNATTVQVEEPRDRPLNLNVSGLLDSVAIRLGGMMAGRFKGTSESDLKNLLSAAGFYTLPARRFLGYQVISTVVAGGLLILIVSGSASAGYAVFLVLVGVLSGWMLPLMYVRRRARERAQSIDYSMPDLIDTLVATVEAGIAFSAALQVASKRFHGPLGEELRLTLQEQNMGLGFQEALDNFLERQNARSVRAFVRSLKQGEELGVAVSQTLRNLSHEMRVLRRQLAEERAQKAPVKLVFPIVLLILPALLLITLGPAIIRIHDLFK